MRALPVVLTALTALLLGTLDVAAQQRAPAPPRPAVPRGPLMADELNNIAVFKAASPSVMNITALGLERDFFSRNVQQVPQGTELHMTLTSAVSSKTSQVGDPVSGTTTSAVIASVPIRPFGPCCSVEPIGMITPRFDFR